jgi:hypothetical protein
MTVLGSLTDIQLYQTKIILTLRKCVKTQVKQQHNTFR